MNNFNPADLFKITSAFNKFKSNHPKLLPFFKASAPKLMQPGTVVEISVTDASGEKLETNLRIQESDIDLFNTLMSMSQQ
ncbi:MAG: hypothetical protein HUJ71_07735 [Pseudobutyrivibrio sp.]|nr:hypothetical protein [Pseudobutyrivibrio sp.]